MGRQEDDLNELVRIADQQNTPYGEQSIAGQDIQAASTTTLPPNQRFAMIVNNDHLTADEVDSEITFDPRNRYTIATGSNDQKIIRTRERNKYLPGSESVAGVAFMLETDVPPGQFMPDSTVLEAGYAGLSQGRVTGTPLTEEQDKDKDGPVLRLTPDDASVRVYKSDAVAAEVFVEDWRVNPFTDPRFEYTANEFVVIRWEFDLYGAGDATLFMRLRDAADDAQYIELVTVGLPQLPLLEVYDQPVSLLVEATDTLAAPVDWSTGPMTFFNRVGGPGPFRNKSEIIRSPTVADNTLGSAGGTVIRVYRMDPERVEALTQVTDLTARSPNGDFRAETREVHRDFLTFPAGFNPDNPDNWRAPDDQRVRDTAVQRAETASNTITIDTFTDSDGVTKARGKQDAVVFANAGGGKSVASESGAVDVTTMSELDYVVLIGRINGNNDPAEVTVRFKQQW